MKRILAWLAFALLIATSAFAQNHNTWNIYAGGSLSHICDTPPVSSDKTYSWGGGAFLGIGYQIKFTKNWSLMPQIECAFDDNGGVLNAKNDLFLNNHGRWQNYWSISIPIFASYGFKISENLGIRFGVGPYIQTILKGKKYKSSYSVIEKESLRGSFDKRLNVGISGEIAVETGNHFSFMFRTIYPFMNRGWLRNTINLSVGVRYSF